MPIPIRQFLIRTRFRFLLASLVLCALLVPALERGDSAELGTRLTVTLVLLAGVYAVAGRGRDLVIAAILAVPAAAVDWLAGPLTDHPWHAVVNHGTSIAFVAFLIWRILQEVYRDERVTADTILGAICAYLLIGWLFAFLFMINEDLGGGSLSDLPATGSGHSYDHFATFFYYSFVTLTTLGYGDFTPVDPFARSLAYFEAIVGQLFPAVLIARFVGIQISESLAAKQAG